MAVSAARCLLCLALAVPVAGADEPLYVRNLSPVAGLVGLPSQRQAEIAPVGGLGLALHSSLANHYVAEQRGDELLNFDGETLRLALELRYAFADDWDLQFELPWLQHSEGHLDAFIDNWHDFWGMSDGGRDLVPRDLLTYGHLGADRFLLRDETSGLGDISLSLSHRVYHRGGTSVSFALGYEFGSGEEEDFLGGGADDVFVLLRFSGDHLGDLPLRWHGQAGYLRAGRIDMISSIQERDLWFAGLAMDWRLAQQWSLLAQVDSHSAPTSSSLDGLGENALIFSGGLRWRPTSRLSVDFSVVEDVVVETAPDVTLQLSVRYDPVDTAGG